MDWKKYIEDAYRSSDNFNKHGTLPIFSNPANQDELESMETSLKFVLPNDLKELLLQTDGIKEKMVLKGQYKLAGTFICSHTEILELNIWYRDNQEDLQIKHNLQEFIFFGKTGVDGIYFAFPISPMNPDGIYAWYPIDAEFVKITDSLKDLTWLWPSDRLNV